MKKTTKLFGMIAVSICILIAIVPATSADKTFVMFDGSRFVCHDDGGMTIYCSDGSIMYFPGLDSGDWAEWMLPDGTYHPCFPPNPH